jgi:hypothetical protein
MEEGGTMSSRKITPVKQSPIEDDAAREALEDILRSRKLPLTNQVQIEHAADLFERALEGLVRYYRQAVEIKRRIAPDDK